MTDREQNIWRTVSSTEHSGYFVWEIAEFVPFEKWVKPKPTNSRFMELRDGTWVLLNCTHVWTEEKVTEILNDTWEGINYYTI